MPQSRQRRDSSDSVATSRNKVDFGAIVLNASKNEKERWTRMGKWGWDHAPAVRKPRRAPKTVVIHESGVLTEPDDPLSPREDSRAWAKAPPKPSFRASFITRIAPRVYGHHRVDDRSWFWRFRREVPRKKLFALPMPAGPPSKRRTYAGPAYKPPNSQHHKLTRTRLTWFTQKLELLWERQKIEQLKRPSPAVANADTTSDPTVPSHSPMPLSRPQSAHLSSAGPSRPQSASRGGAVRPSRPQSASTVRRRSFTPPPLLKIPSNHSQDHSQDASMGPSRPHSASRRSQQSPSPRLKITPNQDTDPPSSCQSTSNLSATNPLSKDARDSHVPDPLHVLRRYVPLRARVPLLPLEQLSANQIEPTPPKSPRKPSHTQLQGPHRPAKNPRYRSLRVLTSPPVSQSQSRRASTAGRGGHPPSDDDIDRDPATSSPQRGAQPPAGRPRHFADQWEEGTDRPGANQRSPSGRGLEAFSHSHSSRLSDPHEEGSGSDRARPTDRNFSRPQSARETYVGGRRRMDGPLERPWSAVSSLAGQDSQTSGSHDVYSSRSHMNSRVLSDLGHPAPTHPAKRRRPRSRSPFSRRNLHLSTEIFSDNPDNMSFSPGSYVKSQEFQSMLVETWWAEHFLKQLDSEKSAMVSRAACPYLLDHSIPGGWRSIREQEAKREASLKQIEPPRTSRAHSHRTLALILASKAASLASALESPSSDRRPSQRDGHSPRNRSVGSCRELALLSPREIVLQKDPGRKGDVTARKGKGEGPQGQIGRPFRLRPDVRLHAREYCTWWVSKLREEEKLEDGLQHVRVHGQEPNYQGQFCTCCAAKEFRLPDRLNKVDAASERERKRQLAATVIQAVWKQRAAYTLFLHLRAAVCVQACWRAWVDAEYAKWLRKLYSNACRRIQKAWRRFRRRRMLLDSHKAGYKIRMYALNFRGRQKLRGAAVKLQVWWRRYLCLWRWRWAYSAIIECVIKAQAVIRRYPFRKRWRYFFDPRWLATITIQRNFKRHRIRLHIWKRRNFKDVAARKIQRAWKAFRLRKAMRDWRTALQQMRMYKFLAKVQRRFRWLQAQRRARKLHAAIKIQALQRSRLAFLLLSRIKAAIAIQSKVRSNLIRTYLLQCRWSAVIIQKWVRRWRAMALLKLLRAEVPRRIRDICEQDMVELAQIRLLDRFLFPPPLRDIDTLRVMDVFLKFRRELHVLYLAYSLRGVYSAEHAFRLTRTNFHAMMRDTRISTDMLAEDITNIFIACTRVPDNPPRPSTPLMTPRPSTPSGRDNDSVFSLALHEMVEALIRIAHTKFSVTFVRPTVSEAATRLTLLFTNCLEPIARPLLQDIDRLEAISARPEIKAILVENDVALRRLFRAITKGTGKLNMSMFLTILKSHGAIGTGLSFSQAIAAFMNSLAEELQAFLIGRPDALAVLPKLLMDYEAFCEGLCRSAGPTLLKDASAAQYANIVKNFVNIVLN